MERKTHGTMNALLMIVTLVAAISLLLCCSTSAKADIVASGEMTLPDGTDNGTWSLDDQGVLYLDCVKLDWNDPSIPDSIVDQANTLRFGPSATDVRVNTYYYKDNILRYEVDEGNPVFTAIDGFLFNTDRTTLRRCPPGAAGRVTVPDGTKIIDFDAFYECRHVTEVLLPDSVEELAQQSFSNCDQLTSITIPRNTNTIHLYAFSGGLTAFYADEANETFMAADGVLLTKEPFAVFLCPGGKTGTFSAPAVSEVGESAFEYAGLTCVTFQDGLTVIHRQAFSGSGLREIHLPATLTTIEENAFSDCKKLESVYFSGTREQWENVAIGNGNTPLQFNTIHCSDDDYPPQPISGYIGEGVSYTLTPDGDLTVNGSGRWESNAFYQDQKIRRVKLNPGVTEIGWSAFEYCYNLESIQIPDTVTTIETYGFYCCNSLKSVIIPDSVTEIAHEVFEGTGSLRYVYYEGTMADWNSIVSMNDNTSLLTCTITCSDGVIYPDYEAAGAEGIVDALSDTVFCVSTGGQYYRITGSGVVPEGTIYSWYGPQTIEFDEGITAISDNSISYVDLLKTVYLPKSLQEIGDNVFAHCDMLEHVYYAGTEEDWALVSVSESAGAVLASTLVCTGGNISLQLSGAEYTIEGFVCPEGEGFYSDAISGQVWLQNYPELLEKLEGEPVWTIAPVGDVNMAVTFSTPKEYYARIDIPASEIPSQAAEADYKVTCDWDGLSAEATVHLIVKAFDMGLPEGIDTPEVIDADLYDQVTLTASVLPYGWKQANVNPWMDFSSDIHFFTEDEYDRTATSRVLYLNTEGEFEATVTLHIANVCIEKQMRFNVTYFDPSTMLPFCSWNGYDSAAYYLGVEVGSGRNDALQQDPFVTQYWLNNHDYYQDMLDGSPEFSYSTEGTAVFEILPHPDWDQPAININLVTLPSAPEVDVIHLFCEWDGMTWSQDYTVSFLDAPAGGLPDSVELSFEEPLTFVAGTEFYPDEMIWFANHWTSPDDSFYNAEIRYIGRYGLNDWTYSHWDDEHNRVAYTLREYGEYTSVLILTSGKVSWQHEFATRVTDENGEIPDASLIIDGSYDIIDGMPSFSQFWAEGLTPEMNENGVYLNNYDMTMRIDSHSYDSISQTTGEKPQWNVDILSGGGTEAVCIEPEYSGEYAYLYFDPMPDHDAVYIVEVTCEWGGLSAAKQIVIYVTESPNGIPEGIVSDLDKDIYVVKADDYMPDFDELFSYANNWSIPGVPTYSNQYSFGEADWDISGSGYVIHTPGVYQAFFSLETGNISCYKEFTVVVTDEDGTVPADRNYLPAPAAKMTLPLSLDTIEEYAFEGTPAECIVLPEGCTGIGNGAFRNCRNLIRITIPDTVTSIADNAFDGCGIMLCQTNSSTVIEYCLSHGIIPLV